MNLFSLEATTNIYASGKKAILIGHSVQFPELRSFAVAVDRLVGILGESSKDEFWINLIRRLKKLRFDFCAAPLPEEVLQSAISGLLVTLNEKQDLCQLIYPGAIRYYAYLFDQLETLSKTRLSRLMDSLLELLGETRDDIGLLIREPRLIPVVEKTLKAYPSLRNVTVVNSSLLREGRCYKRLFVFGPSRWHPPYVFFAPRAPQVTIIKYSWIKDSLKKENVFTAPIKQRISNNDDFRFQDDGEDSDISPEDLLPAAFDFQRIADKAVSELLDSEDSDLSVEARIFLLEDGWAVFLEADETASVMVIDLDSENAEIVKRIKIGEVQSGNFVLLRTGGGGDYIIPVANQVMGDNASLAREFQKEWKYHLRAKARDLGYEQVITRLKELGSIRASPMNLRNWMSDRSIKPGYIEDFSAILRIAGLEKDAETYWDMMKIIDRAHIRAGQLIRGMLLEQVKKSNLNDLKKTGRMDFTIPGEISVSITAFQVREISPDVVNVSPHRIGNPFEPEE